MKRLVVFNYERNKDSISACYFPEDKANDSGYIKLSRSGVVLEERRTEFDKNGEYHKEAMKKVSDSWTMISLPSKTEVVFT